MANKKKYDSILSGMLLPKGFYKHGSNFLRLHGDGVLQSVCFIYEPHTKYIPEWGDGNCLTIAIHSIFERQVFEPVKSLKGRLTHPKMVGELLGFELGKEAKKNPGCNSPKTEWEQLALFQENVLNILDSVDSQDTLCQLLQWADITTFGKPSLVDTSQIAPLAYLGFYEKAIQFCDGIIEQNLHGLKLEEEYLSPEQLAVSRAKVEQRLHTFFQLRKYMLNNDHEEIISTLHMYRDDNVSTLKKLYPSISYSKRTGDGSVS